MGVPRGGPATDVLLNAFKIGRYRRTARGAALSQTCRQLKALLARSIHAMYGEDPEVREAAFYAIEEIGADGFKLPHPNQFGLG